MADKLQGYRILILETREEAQFSRLLAEQGADVLQCPMFTIEDAPDPAPVEAWMRRVIARPPDDLVLMTGEGLRRMMKLARARGIDADFVAAVGQTRRFARGPKPGRALREIGLDADVTTDKPTSDGVAEMLAQRDLKGRRVGLQLYPEKDHDVLIAAIAALGAEIDTVLPYVYDSKAAEANIVGAIDEMAAGRVDALRAAMANTPVASVGPVVSDELTACGFRTDIYPANDTFFMKPLIAAMSVALNRSAPRPRIG